MKKFIVFFVLVVLFVPSVAVKASETINLGLFGECEIKSNALEFPKDCRLSEFSLEEISSNGMTLSFRMPFDGWIDTESSMTPFVNGGQKDFGIYSDLPNREDFLIPTGSIINLQVSKNAQPEKIYFRIVLKDDSK